MALGGVSPETVGELMRDAAAVAILPRFRSLTDAEISTKQGGELVTAADIEAEKILSRELTALLPGSIAIGEEACAEDPGLKTAIGSDQYVWIIDPVDGTRNFADGVERFCSIVALTKSGETVLGCILEPLPDRLAWAEQGSGAFLEQEKLTVAAPRPLSQCIGFVNDNLFPASSAQLVAALKAGFGDPVTLRTMGLEHVELAAGRADISVYGRLDPWDHAAGVLIHQEAGGFAALTDRRPYVPTCEAGILILASNRAAWNEARRLIADQI